MVIVLQFKIRFLPELSNLGEILLTFESDTFEINLHFIPKILVRNAIFKLIFRRGYRLQGGFRIVFISNGF